MNELDIRNMIKRSIARDKPRTMPKMTKEDKEKMKKKFTSAELYAKIPHDFKGDKFEYALFKKQELKEKAELLNGTSSLAQRRKEYT